VRERASAAGWSRHCFVHDLMTRTAWLAIGVLAACGGGGNGTEPDAVPEPDADLTLCAGKPCLTSIDDVADWTRVAATYTGQRCDFLEDGKYIAPATASAALQEIVFQDVEVHRLHLEFMTQELPQFFGGLSPQMYQEIVQRRATRQYWAGSVYRLVDEFGTTEGYGFDVITDPTSYEEELTETEIGAIEAQLETRFHLPLVYAPTRLEAIYTAYSFTEVEAHFSRACHFVTCPTAGVDCVVVPSAVSVCGVFLEGRSIQVEHAQKATLAAVPGTYDLPRAAGEHQVPAIFGAGEFGPTRIPIAPAGATATYTVTDYGTFSAHDYTQSFTAGTHTLELAWQVQLPQGGGGFLFEEPYVSRNLWANAVVDGSKSYDDVIGLSSCTAEDIEHWRIDGTMAGGDGFSIDFQYQPPAAGSGPLFPTRGRVTLGGQTATVTDYYDLVYAGEHHNWNNQYWVLFDTPLTYLGHPVHGLWLDEQPYMFELEAAYTLDAAHQPLDTLTVTAYDVAKVP
jgi:hypothetical protein